MPRLQRPLDPKAVAAANASVAGETGGRQLTMEPKDAALRKKWVAAYLAAGGKEAKNFNPKPVKKSVEICPKTNWIEVELPILAATLQVADKPFVPGKDPAHDGMTAQSTPSVVILCLILHSYGKPP